MPKFSISSIGELKSLEGREVALSDWLTITQERINAFADATDDHQWIHVDVERCGRESPFGSTIAHGFLTLSLLSKFMNESVDFGPSRMGVNYGGNRVRFTDPVPVGSRIRARIALGSLDDIPGGVQIGWNVTMEREGSDKPCLVAEWLTRRYA